MAVVALDGNGIAEQREAVKAMGEAANKASKAIKAQAEELTTLFTLIRKNPNLPIMAMVDGEIVGDNCYARWCGSWGTAYIDKYITHKDYGVIFYEQGRPDTTDIFEKYFDYEECKITNDMPDDEAFKIMREKVDSLPWIEAIIVYIDLPENL